MRQPPQIHSPTRTQRIFEQTHLAISTITQVFQSLTRRLDAPVRCRSHLFGRVGCPSDKDQLPTWSG